MCIASGVNVTIINSTISKNQASDYGGGIYISSNGTLYITSSIISNNYAAVGGGGIYMGSPSGKVYLNYGTVITGNTAGDSYGGLQQHTHTYTHHTHACAHTHSLSFSLSRECTMLLLFLFLIFGKKKFCTGGVFMYSGAISTGVNISSNFAGIDGGK